VQFRACAKKEGESVGPREGRNQERTINEEKDGVLFRKQFKLRLKACAQGWKFKGRIALRATRGTSRKKQRGISNSNRFRQHD